MSNPLVNWWRSSQFHTALKQGNERKAAQILQEIENSGAKLSWLEQLFRKKLEAEESSAFHKRELTAVSARLNAVLQNADELEEPTNSDRNVEDLLLSNTEFVQFIHDSFRLTYHHDGRLQCTGIDKRVFDEFEANLAKFLSTELEKLPKSFLTSELESAFKDLEGLKQEIDPQYNFKLTPYVYFIEYFLNNVYSDYLAWFLLYEASLIPKNLKILDIAAGPGTVTYGLALLLQSNSGFFPPPQMHISSYSLEKQYLLQFRGLQFWRQSIDSKPIAKTTYFRFDTADIFDYNSRVNKLPDKFFNFIVISHGFFYDTQRRRESYTIYKKIFQDCLAIDGYVLLIIPSQLIWNSHQDADREDLSQEETIIQNILEDLELTLEWYKYVTSTGKRIPLDETDFEEWAKENLPEQKYMNPLRQQYLGREIELRYSLNDYVILAKR